MNPIHSLKEYLRENQEEQKKNKAVIFVSALAVLLFLGTALFLPFKQRLNQILYPKSVSQAFSGGIYSPTINSNPVLYFGNTSYHDSVGARDPSIATYNGTYYLYYDCSEDLLNPSFESNWGTNGWNTWHASETVSSSYHFSGSQSLAVTTDGTVGAGAFNGDYFYNTTSSKGWSAPGIDPYTNGWAVAGGLQVEPNTTYVVSAYVLYPSGTTTAKLVTQQYTDDPYYYSNVISGTVDTATISANGSWQRVAIAFTTTSNAKVITISLVSDTALTLYWDAIQMERVPNLTLSSPVASTGTGVIGTPTGGTAFPTNQSFNSTLQDVINWRSCYATSPDGINFTKYGVLPVLDTYTDGSGLKPDENFAQPGTVGSDTTYANVFPYNGLWYAYLWEDGGPISPSSPFASNTYPYHGLPVVSDPGASNRRAYYNDLHAMFAGGAKVYSGLVQGNSPAGPFTRLKFPALTVPGDPGISTYTNSCATTNRGYNAVWGCDYYAANQAPVYINGQWILFTDGNTDQTKYVSGGTAGPPGTNGYYGINSGYATSNSPLGPWNYAQNNPLFSPPNIIVPLGAQEGPAHYYDTGSGYHFLFNNQISGGAHGIQAFWSNNPLVPWNDTSQSVSVVDWGHIPWNNGYTISDYTKQVNINLSSETTNLSNSNQMNMYFGVRVISSNEPATETEPDSTRSFEFHDIGLVTFPLPLISSQAPVSPAVTSSSQGSISGPTSANVGQSLTYTVNATDSNNTLSSGEIWVMTQAQTSPWPYSCPGATTGPWCKITSASLSGGLGSYSGSWTPSTANTYIVVPNIYDTTGTECSGNPNLTPGYGTTIVGCGAFSSLTVTISSGAASGTISANPNPCTSSSINSACNSNITYTYTSSGVVCVNNQVFSGGPSGSTSSAPWILPYFSYAFALNSTNTSNCTGNNIAATVVTATIPTPTPTSTPTSTPVPPTSTPTPTDNPPIGNFDGVSCSQFSGWTCDPDSWSTPLRVDFYQDGPAGSGIGIGSTTANVTREPAVGQVCGNGTSNHGFLFTPPSSLNDGRNHTYYAYGIDTNGSNNSLLPPSPLSLTCAVPTSTPIPTATVSIHVQDNNGIPITNTTLLYNDGLADSNLCGLAPYAPVGNINTDGNGNITLGIGVNLPVGTLFCLRKQTPAGYQTPPSVSPPAPCYPASGKTVTDTGPDCQEWQQLQTGGNSYTFTYSPALNLAYQQLPSSGNDIGVGANGTVIIIDNTPAYQGFGIDEWNGSSWVNIPGGAVRVAVAPDGTPWAVNNIGQVFHLVNGTFQFINTPEPGSDIGVGANGSVWMIGASQAIWNYNGSSWSQAPGGATRIAVDPSGNPWVVNSGGNIYKWIGNTFQQVSGPPASDIGVGADGSIWITGTDGNIQKWNGSLWLRSNGTAVNLSVGPDGNPWVVNSAHQIFDVAGASYTYVNLQPPTPTNTPIPTVTPTSTPTSTPTPLPPIGNLDGVSCTSFVGWSCDPTSYGSNNTVNFYQDGDSNSGTYIGNTTANGSSNTGVTAACGNTPNHGFTFNTPSYQSDPSLYSGTPHSIYAYGVGINGTTLGNLNTSPQSLTCIPPTPTPNPKYLAGDLDLDGSINLGDLSYLLSHFNQTVPNYTQGDLNGDGTINSLDYSLELTNLKNNGTI